MKKNNLQKDNKSSKADTAYKAVKGTFYGVKILYTIGMFVLAGIIVAAIVAACRAVGSSINSFLFR